MDPIPAWLAVLIILIVVWTLPWKGVALWRAARNRHTWWFIAILIINSLAILEIIYILAFSRKKETAAPPT